MTQTSDKNEDFSIKGSGITRRWVLVGLLLTIVILLVGSCAVLLSLRQSYYSLAQQALEFRITSTLRLMPSRTQSSAERVAALRSLVEDFDEKDKFEFMLVDGDGRVTVTSSGFAYGEDEPLDDYREAASSSDGMGTFIGTSASGEHIIAVTKMLTSPIGDTAAIRFVSSLREIDSQLGSAAGITAAICLIVLFFVVSSGIYFVRSIVIPINEIGRTAKRIADGDFSVRIENKYNDETGTLCDIINDMAAGLGEADRVKNDFISSVSHELRTPLTSIKGWGETLAEIGPDNRETFDKGMKIIISETDRLSVLVEDLLDFSRLQSARITVNKENFNLTEELSGAVQTAEQRVLSQHMKITLDAPKQPVMIDADRHRLRQVFTNIIDNAVKYSSSGGVISICERVEGDNAVIITRDYGAGIPPQDLPKITQKYFKASNSVTGSGIGLAVVKEIVELHSGTLTLDSELGHGTTVTVRLPLKSGEKIENNSQSGERGL